MKTLYVTDLDGTLMRNDMTISKESIRILNDLIDRGVLITYATARSFFSSYEITKEIRFAIPVITRNGNTLADQKNAKELKTLFFPDDVLRRLKEMLPIIGKCGFTSVYDEGKMYKYYLKGPKSVEFQGYIDYYDSIGDKRITMKDDIDILFARNVSYITLISSEEELLPYYEAVKDSTEWETIFQKDTYRDEFWLEICPKDSTKAKAILKLKEELGCDRLVVFGDSKNDLPMFGIADEAIAVANARPETIAKATLTIGSNEEDAVASYIRDQEGKSDDIQ